MSAEPPLSALDVRYVGCSLKQDVWSALCCRWGGGGIETRQVSSCRQAIGHFSVPGTKGGRRKAAQVEGSWGKPGLRRRDAPRGPHFVCCRGAETDRSVWGGYRRSCTSTVVIRVGGPRTMTHGCCVLGCVLSSLSLHRCRLCRLGLSLPCHSHRLISYHSIGESTGCASCAFILFRTSCVFVWCQVTKRRPH